MPLIFWLWLLVRYYHRHLKRWFRRLVSGKSCSRFGRRKPKQGEDKKTVY